VFFVGIKVAKIEGGDLACAGAGVTQKLQDCVVAKAIIFLKIDGLERCKKLLNINGRVRSTFCALIRWIYVSLEFSGSTRISVEKACDALEVIPSVARNLIDLSQESRFLGLRPRNDKRAFPTLIRDEPIFLPRLDCASARQVRLSWFTCFRRRVIVGGLISIFIRDAPQVFDIIPVLTTSSDGF
jgi:hypothetical protein